MKTITLARACAAGFALSLGVAQAASVGEVSTAPETGAVVNPAGAGPVYRAPAAVLHTNGSLQTAATGGGPAGTSPVSVLTAPDTTLGAACNGAAAGNTFRLADDFTVPAGGWRVNKVTVFGYQTQVAPGGATTSSFTAGVLRIWNGPPNVAGSTVVVGDTTTNVQTATSFSGVWRVSSTTLTNLQRPVMAVELSIPQTLLAPGTYWVEYGLTGSLAVTVFCPPVAANGNALQFSAATSTWAAVTDTGSMRVLDLPFIVEGDLAGGSLGPSVPVPTLSAAGLLLAALVMLLGGLLAARRAH